MEFLFRLFVCSPQQSTVCLEVKALADGEFYYLELSPPIRAS